MCMDTNLAKIDKTFILYELTMDENCVVNKKYKKI